MKAARLLLVSLAFALVPLTAQALSPLPPPDPVTLGPMTLYVNCAGRGSDRNTTCAQATPCATIQHALARVPPRITYPVTIVVSAGTCVPTTAATSQQYGPEIGAHATVDIEGFSIDPTLNANAGLTIQGSTASVLPSAVVTVATTSAVFSTTTLTIPAPAGGWAAAGVSSSYLNGGDGGLLDNGLTGTMLRTVSGTAAGAFVPVISNTSNTVTVPYNGADTASVVDVRSLATIINASTLPDGGTSVVWVDVQSANPTPSFLDYTVSHPVNLDKLALDMTGTPANVGIGLTVRGTSPVAFTGSSITDATANTALQVQGPGAVLDGVGLYLYSSSGSAHNLALRSEYGARTTITDSYLRSFYDGAQAYGAGAQLTLQLGYAQSRDGLAYSSQQGAQLSVASMDIVDWNKSMTAPIYVGAQAYVAAASIHYTTDGGQALVACGGGSYIDLSSDTVLSGTPITADAGAQELSMDLGITYVGFSTINNLTSTTNYNLAQANTLCLAHKLY